MPQPQWLNIPLSPYIRLLAKYLRPLRVQVFSLALVIVVGTALQLLNPYILRYFIDSAEADGVLLDLFGAAGLFIGIALLYQAVLVAQRYLAEKVAWQATNALRVDLTRHCLHLKIAFHNSRTPGELLERIDGDVGALAHFFSQFACVIVANALLLVGILTVLFWEDWRIGLPLLLFVLFAFQASVYVHHRSTPFWPAARESFARLMGFLEERLSTTEEIRANGATAYMMNGPYRHMRDRTQTLFRAYMMMVATFSTSIGLMSLGSVIALGVGAYLLQLNAITIGMVFLTFRYTTLLIEPIEFLMLELINFQQATASISRIEELFALQSEQEDKGETELRNGPLSVAFHDVTFRYSADTPSPTLDNISFDLPPGAVLGVVGRTGSGKSTLARLITRLYDAPLGGIEIGGVDIQQISPRIIRQHVGMVTQDVQLFQATIRENLTFFNESIPDVRILDALHQLGLGAWYGSLPKGLDTEVASGGQSLSAGEAQLLAFTRIWLRDPSIVILDEATSRLDPFTEALTEQAVANLFGKGQRTGIIIAHRLATLQHVDFVMILEQGRMVEYGSRQGLMDDPSSRFYQLLHINGDESSTNNEVLL